MAKPIVWERCDRLLHLEITQLSKVVVQIIIYHTVLTYGICPIILQKNTASSIYRFISSSIKAAAMV